MSSSDVGGGDSDLVLWERDEAGEVRFRRPLPGGGFVEHGYERPFILELEITWRCNLRCLHCYVDATELRRCDELTLGEIETILDEAVALGVEELSLTGGEVLMRADLPEILAMGRDRGMGLRFVTNGSLLDEAWFERLRPFPLKLVTISLDGVDPAVHDELRGAPCHAPTVAAIERLLDGGVPVSIITAFSRPNVGQFDAIHAFCVERGLPWQVQTTTAKGRCPKDLTLSPREYYGLGMAVARRIAEGSPVPIIPMDDLATYSRYEPLSMLSATWQGGCSGGKLNLFVRANGDVTPCSALAFDEFVVGNVRREGLTALCRDAACGRCMERWLSVEGLEGFCATCPHAFDCRGGCPEILVSMGDGRRENRYCYWRIEEEALKEELGGIWG